MTGLTTPGSFPFSVNFMARFAGDLDDRRLIKTSADRLLFTKSEHKVYNGFWTVAQNIDSETGLSEPVMFLLTDAENPDSEDSWIELGSGAGLKYQNITSGGNKNDLELTGNVLVFTNENAQAIIQGLDPSKYNKVYLLNYSDYELALVNEASSSTAESRIALPTNMPTFGIEGVCELIYLPTIQRWKIVGAFGTKYRPEHRGLSEEMVMTVDEDAVSKTNPIIDLKLYRDAQTESMTNDQLNLEYPNARRGLEIVCPLLGLKYEKVDNNTNEWNTIHLM
tara:strand:+ start:13448 stop:14287 length:840 start_codon:yes stop_codon:yes gene_type:complete